MTTNLTLVKYPKVESVNALHTHKHLSWPERIRWQQVSSYDW